VSQAEVSEEVLWLLSYYRSSEIRGSLFFGRLANALRPGPIQHDLSKHFADEAQHAWYWTDCIDRLGARPMKLDEAYQDQYLEAAGLPANMMEILAITFVFEHRVIDQYNRHLKAPTVHPQIQDTIRRIMKDEGWHLYWVRKALDGMEERFGADEVERTLERFRQADREVYAKTLAEHTDVLSIVLGPTGVEGDIDADDDHR
jgi:bacterioferritin (cytochrome b1)